MTKRIKRGKNYLNGGVVTEHISYMNGDDKRETIISFGDDRRNVEFSNDLTGLRIDGNGPVFYSQAVKRTW